LCDARLAWATCVAPDRHSPRPSSHHRTSFVIVIVVDDACCAFAIIANFVARRAAAMSSLSPYPVAPSPVVPLPSFLVGCCVDATYNAAPSQAMSAAAVAARFSRHRHVAQSAPAPPTNASHRSPYPVAPSSAAPSPSFLVGCCVDAAYDAAPSQATSAAAAAARSSRRRHVAQSAPAPPTNASHCRTPELTRPLCFRLVGRHRGVSACPLERGGPLH
jgi:hypothetical protein